MEIKVALLPEIKYKSKLINLAIQLVCISLKKSLFTIFTRHSLKFVNELNSLYK